MDDIKLYEDYIKEILSSNDTVGNPNFSIVMPGGCNGKCSFCFWEKAKTCGNYSEKLKETLDLLPKQFDQLSITGGEPTISPYLAEVLNMIDRKKFKKVVLTTNGANLLNTIPILEGKVDHVNISRHHYKDSLNEEVFKTKMSNKEQLKKMTLELNKIGIDVTFSAVLNENLNTQDDIEKYIKFAKKCGATQVFF